MPTLYSLFGYRGFRFYLVTPLLLFFTNSQQLRKFCRCRTPAKALYHSAALFRLRVSPYTTAANLPHSASALLNTVGEVSCMESL